MAQEAVEEFIQRWDKADGTERANYQLFLTEFCRVLDLPQPEPANSDARDNAYIFERRVGINHPDGTQTNGFIDLYRRGSFVCEAKQSGKELDTSGWDRAMLRAQNQADQYARALPVDEGRPPFIVVTDVGRNIELYAEFSRSGATYTPFPDARSHRIRLTDLRKDEIRERLRAVWLDPLSLDPSRHAARVTRDIASNLAQLARSLEAAGHDAEIVTRFLMRALFTMFAEDVGLLPDHAFTELLKSLRNDPSSFAPMLENLWSVMNTGGFSPILRKTILRFNGGLFSQPTALPLDRDQFELLVQASEADWKFVEPAIFGTLLERALNPRERHKLGAHFTPRAYVERLVLPTVIEPLRAEWQEVQAAALTYERQGKTKFALNEIHNFQRHLCSVRVLDPACGSGNFLYVTLEHLKRLEGEVLNLLHDLGESRTLETEGLTVDPHQFLGLEVNPRAAKIAEMVLWIGYLQWHFRTMGHVNPPEPVLRDFKNIESRDALIEYDSVEKVLDGEGRPVTRWDGITYKVSPITGEEVPDESARITQYKYTGLRKAEWPQADYVVGNPPFIGTKRMRATLGDGYVDAVRDTWSEVPDSADFVMYWWHIAAEAVCAGRVQRFGFITTNSIKQSFNRRVIEPYLAAAQPLSIIFAIPDHPWVDASDGAAVRISMTVAASGDLEGRAAMVIREETTNTDSTNAVLQEHTGKVSADLTVGANASQAVPLGAARDISGMGSALHGAGFILTAEEAKELAQYGAAVIRPYLGGRDLLQTCRERYVIDFSSLSEEEALEANRHAFQYVMDHVKPERDHNRRDSIRELWWRFGWERPKLRAALKGISRFIGTTETAKHRVFQFIDGSYVADHMIVCVALSDAYILGCLSSRLHVAWALAAGGRLGVGNDPRYNKSRCFDTFPFPDATVGNHATIREIAEKIDAHRKRQQAQYPDLTLTGMYNVLEGLRLGRALSAKEKIIHEHGLVSLLRELHDELDRAVFAAYGWADLAEELVGLPGATVPYPGKPESQALAEGELLTRLVKLNAARAAEEAQGLIRWLRPKYQHPTGETAPQQIEVELAPGEKTAAKPKGKVTWPKNMREQVAAVCDALQKTTLTANDIARGFKRSPVVAVQSVLDALQDLGMVEGAQGRYRLLR